MEKNHFFLMFFATIFGVVLLVVAAFFLPWSKIRWGKMELSPARTITVVGEAEGQQKSQIAQFTVGGAGGGGTPIEPGSSSVRKSATVVFEIE